MIWYTKYKAHCSHNATLLQGNDCKHDAVCVLQCMWKLTKKLPLIVTTLNKEQLFVDLDKFFTDYLAMNVTPSDEIAFRTVKTVIFHIVNIMGAKVSVVLCI